jgi:hypothetical protein
LASCYLWALYEADALDEAESVFGQYQDIILESAVLDFQAVAHLSMARIHDIRGRPSKALAGIDQAEAIAYANDWRRLLRTLGWERTRRALLSGDHERAEAIAAAMADQTEAAPEWLQFSEDLEGETLGRIRMAIHWGNSNLAKELLKTEFARRRGRPFRQIKLNLLDAELHYRTGARNHAQRSLGKRRSRDRGQRGGVRQLNPSLRFDVDGVIDLQILSEDGERVLCRGLRADGASGRSATVAPLLAMERPLSDTSTKPATSMAIVRHDPHTRNVRRSGSDDRRDLQVRKTLTSRRSISFSGPRSPFSSSLCITLCDTRGD